jgi:hypothetical protein
MNLAILKSKKMAIVAGISVAILLIVFAILQMQSISFIMRPGPKNSTLVYVLSCILLTIIAVVCGKKDKKILNLLANILWIVLWILFMSGLIIAMINLDILLEM